MNPLEKIDLTPVSVGFLQAFLCLGRQAFGDGEMLHVFRCKTKTAGSKKMVTFAHSDYTLAVAVTDEDKNYAQGAAQIAVQRLMEAYKEAGY